MTPILIAPPAVEPVALADAREWLRLDSSAEDDLVTALIVSARLIVEAATRRQLITQGWRLVFDRWPGLGSHHDGVRVRPEIMFFPMAPFQSLTAMRVYDVNRVAQVLAPSIYTVASAPEQARLVFTSAPPKPGVPIAGIEIDIVCGYGDQPSSVPEPLRLAIKMLVARWFDNRGDIETDGSVDRLPGPIDALIAPFRRTRLA